MNTGFEEILLMIGVGVLVGGVSNVISHFLAISREKMRQEWQEAQDEEDCDDSQEIEVTLTKKRSEQNSDLM